MTVTAKQSRKLITGSGWANPLTHDFYLANSSYLHVYADDEELVSGVDYSVSGVADEAGYSVTITTPGDWDPAVWVLDVVPPISQEEDVSLGGTFGARFEVALDRLTTKLQYVYELTARSIKAPLTTPEGDFTVDPDILTDLEGLSAAADAAIAAAEQTADDVIATAASASTATSAASTATAAALAAGVAVAALAYAFSTTTSDADPGNGIFRLNNATPASATALYIDNVDSDGVTMSSVIDTFDDSTNTTRGTLTIRSKLDASVKYVYRVTGAVVDGTGYRKVTLAYVAGSGTIANAADCYLIFNRAGDKGTDGAGAGDVVGPASATNNGFVKFDGTTGKLVKDSAATLGTTDYGDATVSYAKIVNATALSLLGRASSSSGVLADIAAASDGQVMRRSGTSIGFGAVNLASANAVTGTLPAANLPAASDTAIGAIEIAVQSEMETGSDTGRAVVPGRQQYHPSAAKFWAVVSQSGGTPTLTTSYNVTSITDTGTGQLTVTIATDFSSANWCALGGVHSTNDLMPTIGSRAAGTVRLDAYSSGGSLEDPTSSWNVVGYGDQ